MIQILILFLIAMCFLEIHVHVFYLFYSFPFPKNIFLSLGRSVQTFKNIDVHVHVHLLGTNFMFQEIITSLVAVLKKYTL